MVQVRVIVIAPPLGVRFAVQRGKTGLLEPSVERAEFLQFDLALRRGAPQADGSPNYLGEFAQGPASDRFVYLNSGTLAGQAESPWTRRAKLKLSSIPPEIAEAALVAPGRIIEARVQGTAEGGGPVFASVKPNLLAWRLVL
jgi:hypothetical protein